MFQRLHTRDEFEGTGIGLAIARKVVERHGGEISAAPREQGGTCFAFTLPGGRPVSPLASHRPARVLLVEDNEADVRLTREALREAGEDVRLSAVGDGEQALALPAPAGRASPTRRGRIWCCSTSTCRARTGSRCSTRCAPTRRSRTSP